MQSIYYLFKLLDVEKGKKELIDWGLKDLYEVEDYQTKELLLGGRSNQALPVFQYAELVSQQDAAIDWENQWAHFAEDFSEGRAHIDLTRFGKKEKLLLEAGPGFGDLSHPTTELMLEMIKGKVKGRAILDIGTGSGILSLASLLLGATSAIGIDIDPEALKHARRNREINHLTKKARFVKKLAKNAPSSQICLINMIFSEQQKALKNIEVYNLLAKLWITSGILSEQKQAYLEYTKSLGWKLKGIRQKKGWLGFLFDPPTKNRGVFS